jgi:hypothetical protein
MTCRFILVSLNTEGRLTGTMPNKKDNSAYFTNITETKQIIIPDHIN